jgi:hypothetical protein
MALSEEQKTKSNDDESPEQQQKHVWSTVCAHNQIDSNCSNRKWPSYDSVMSGVANSDYYFTLTCPRDLYATKKDRKALCPFGVSPFAAKCNYFPAPVTKNLMQDS